MSREFAGVNEVSEETARELSALLDRIRRIGDAQLEAVVRSGVEEVDEMFRDGGG